MVSKGVVKLCGGGQPTGGGPKHRHVPMSRRQANTNSNRGGASTTSSCSSSSAASTSSYSCPSCVKTMQGEPVHIHKLKKLSSPRSKMKAGMGGEGGKYFYRRYKHTTVTSSAQEDYCPSLANYAFLALIYFIWTMTVLLFQ